MLGNVKLGDITGRTKKGEVGIEVEVEAENMLPIIDTTYWRTDKERSLRGGVEYITKGALSLDIKSKQCAFLIKKINEANSKVLKDSHRTSVHVHNNVGEFTPVQVWTGITAYYLVENILFHEYFGKERIGNLFCLRLKDAESILNDICQDLKSFRPFSSFDLERHKYAAINIASIMEKCSVELRGMRGLVTADGIDIWSSGSYGIFKKAADKWSSPAALLDDYYLNDWRYIVSSLFEDPIKKLLLECKHGSEFMEENALRLTSYAYSLPWNKYQKNINEYFSKAAERPRKEEGWLAAAKQEIALKKKLNQERMMVNQPIDAVNWWGIEPRPIVPKKPRVKVAPRQPDVPLN